MSEPSQENSLPNYLKIVRPTNFKEFNEYESIIFKIKYDQEHVEHLRTLLSNIQNWIIYYSLIMTERSNIMKCCGKPKVVNKKQDIYRIYDEYFPEKQSIKNTQIIKENEKNLTDAHDQIKQMFCIFSNDNGNNTKKNLKSIVRRLRILEIKVTRWFTKLLLQESVDGI